MYHLARNYQKFPGGACPQTPLAVGAFGTFLCHIRLPLLKILATALVQAITLSQIHLHVSNSYSP